MVPDTVVETVEVLPVWRPSDVDANGPQLSLTVERVATTGDAGLQVIVAVSRPTNPCTRPSAGRAGAAPRAVVPTGSPGQGVTLGSAESNVKVALRSGLTVRSDDGISQQPKPNTPPLLRSRLTRFVFGSVI